MKALHSTTWIEGEPMTFHGLEQSCVESSKLIEQPNRHLIIRKHCFLYYSERSTYYNPPSHVANDSNFTLSHSDFRFFSQSQLKKNKEKHHHYKVRKRINYHNKEVMFTNYLPINDAPLSIDEMDKALLSTRTYTIKGFIHGGYRYAVFNLALALHFKNKYKIALNQTKKPNESSINTVSVVTSREFNNALKHFYQKLTKYIHERKTLGNIIHGFKHPFLLRAAESRLLTTYFYNRLVLKYILLELNKSLKRKVIKRRKTKMLRRFRKCYDAKFKKMRLSFFGSKKAQINDDHLENVLKVSREAPFYTLGQRTAVYPIHIRSYFFLMPTHWGISRQTDLALFDLAHFQ
jgi:hypothetical protein